MNYVLSNCCLVSNYSLWKLLLFTVFLLRSSEIFSSPHPAPLNFRFTLLSFILIQSLVSLFSFPVLSLLRFLFCISFYSSQFSFHFGLQKAYHHFIIAICSPPTPLFFLLVLFRSFSSPLSPTSISANPNPYPRTTYNVTFPLPYLPFLNIQSYCFFIVSSLFSKHRIQRHFNSWILLANCNFIYYRQITERLFPAQTKFWQTKAQDNKVMQK